VATYTANALNQYDQRTVLPVVNVLGSAAPGAVVTATSPDGTVTALRQGGDFAAEVPVVNKVNGQPVPKYPTIEIKGRVNEVNGQNAVTDTSSTQTGKHFLAGDPEAFAHDEDGNLLHDGRWAYTWDGENRLIAVETRAAAVTAGVPRTKIEYAYDGRGRRIRQIVRTGWDGSAYAQAVARRFLYDSGWNVLAEIDEAGAVVRRCLWGLDVSGSREGAGGIGGLLVESLPATPGGALTDCFPFYDGNGNITGLLDAAGSEVARYEYGPFGETLRQSGPLAAANPWRWSTKWTEEATGLKDYGYRWLGDGRWLSRDPIEEEGGVNLYTAISNTLPNDIDLLGLRACTEHRFSLAMKAALPSWLEAAIGGPNVSGEISMQGSVRKCDDCCTGVRGRLVGALRFEDVPVRVGAVPLGFARKGGPKGGLLAIGSVEVSGEFSFELCPNNKVDMSGTGSIRIGGGLKLGLDSSAAGLFGTGELGGEMALKAGLNGEGDHKVQVGILGRVSGNIRIRGVAKLGPAQYNWIRQWEAGSPWIMLVGASESGFQLFGTTAFKW
jgi:RHS repeat-associated protein